MLFRSVFKSLSALKDPYYWKLIFLSLIITASMFGGFTYGIKFLLEALGTSGWLSWLGTFGATIISWFLFPLLFPIITSLFVDKVANRMEKTHGLMAQAITPPPLSSTITAAIKFSLTALLLNILFLFFYFIPVIGIFIYLMVNGYLYGREYFEIVGLRFQKQKEIRALRKENKWKVRLAGVFIIILFTTPFLNLIAPILATIFMVLIYHKVITAENTKTPTV